MSIAPAVGEWFIANGRDLPWRKPGFTAWGSLVSEFMLQQTPVARVIPQLESWLARWPTPADLAAETPGEAIRAWDRLGYPRRALNLHAAAVAITDRHGGVVPESVEELLALPGVGDYTARAVAVFAYGHRHPVVDVNIRRVIARAVHGRAEPAAPSVRRDLTDMESLLPDDSAAARLTNVAIMELGAIVCVARNPRCESCPIADQCSWRLAGYPVSKALTAPKQKYAGSNRQARGLILAHIRASSWPISAGEIEQIVADREQGRQALAGLIRDGLVVGNTEDGYRLP